MTRQAVIVSTARTPIGKAFRGAFNLTHGADMLGARHRARHRARRHRAGRRRGRRARLRVARRLHGQQRGASCRAARRLPGHHRRHDDQPLLLLRPAGRSRSPRSAVVVDGAPVMVGGGVESITRVQNNLNMNDLVNPWLHRAQARDLHADGADGRSRGGALQGDARGAGRVRAALAAAHRRRAEGRQDRRRDRADPRDDGGEGQGDRAETSQKALRFGMDEGNRPDTTLEGLAKLPPAFNPEAARSPPATPRSSPTAPPRSC